MQMDITQWLQIRPELKFCFIAILMHHRRDLCATLMGPHVLLIAESIRLPGLSSCSSMKNIRATGCCNGFPGNEHCKLNGRIVRNIPGDTRNFYWNIIEGSQRFSDRVGVLKIFFCNRFSDHRCIRLRQNCFAVTFYNGKSNISRKLASAYTTSSSFKRVLS